MCTSLFSSPVSGPLSATAFPVSRFILTIVFVDETHAQSILFVLRGADEAGDQKSPSIHKECAPILSIISLLDYFMRLYSFYLVTFFLRYFLKKFCYLFANIL